MKVEPKSLQFEILECGSYVERENMGEDIGTFCHDPPEWTKLKVKEYQKNSMGAFTSILI